MAKLNIIQYPLTKNRCFQKRQIRKPIGIQLHTIGCAQGTAKAVADYWNQSGVDCLTTYICDADVAGRVYQLVDEDVYTWADAGYGNRNLITFEIAESDFMKYTGGANFTITNEEKFKADILRGYDTAVLLCADICKRYKWDPTSRLSSGLFLISSHDEGRRLGLSSAHVDPTHVWGRLGLTMDTFRLAVKNAMDGKFESTPESLDIKWFRVRKTWKDEKSQIGAYEDLEKAKSACPYLYSVYSVDGIAVYSNKTKPQGTQAGEFAGLSEGDAARKMLELVRNTDKSGILYSVTTAQMILESGYVKTNLARSANNCFGMKATLSGNSWESVWDGKSIVDILTPEDDGTGRIYYIHAKFRKYPCIEDSIKDHSCYLLGAMNGKKKRYDGITSCANYRDAITLIKKGGYATDVSYIAKICSIIQRYSLDIYDKEVTGAEKIPDTPNEKVEEYIVQTGAYKMDKYLNKHLEHLEEKGYSLSNKKVQVKLMDDGLKHVIVGVYKVKANANKKAAELEKAGFKTEIFPG